MKKRILAFCLTLFLVMGSTSLIFATTASAADRIPSTMVFSGSDVTVAEGETTVTVPFYLTGVPVFDVEDDPNNQYIGYYSRGVGGMEIQINFDTSKLQLKSVLITGRTVAIKQLFDSVQPPAIPEAATSGWFKFICWSTPPSLDLATEGINDMLFASATFTIKSGWSGSTELDIRPADGVPYNRSIINRFEDGAHFDFAVENPTITLPTPPLNVGIEGTGSVSVGIGAETPEVITTSKGYTPEVGSAVNLVAEGENFSFWKNAKSNAIISTSRTLSFTATGTARSVTAVFSEPTIGTTTTYPVYFRDSVSGKIYQTLNIEEGTALTAGDMPTAPAMLGFTFERWQVLTDRGYVDAVDFVINEATTVITSYAKDRSVTYTLSVTMPEYFKTFDRSFGAVATVTARGANFAYWEMNNSVIVSTDPSYTFVMPNHNVALEAVYDVTKPEATVAMLSCLVDDAGNLLTTISRSATGGNTIVESGVLLTRKATPADLVVDTSISSVTKAVSSLGSGTTIAFKKSNMFNKLGTWYVRGYMTVSDGTTLTTHYTQTYQVALTTDNAVAGTVYNP